MTTAILIPHTCSQCGDSFEIEESTIPKDYIVAGIPYPEYVPICENCLSNMTTGEIAAITGLGDYSHAIGISFHDQWHKKTKAAYETCFCVNSMVSEKTIEILDKLGFKWPYQPKIATVANLTDTLLGIREIQQ